VTVSTLSNMDGGPGGGDARSRRTSPLHPELPNTNEADPGYPHGFEQNSKRHALVMIMKGKGSNAAWLAHRDGIRQAIQSHPQRIDIMTSNGNTKRISAECYILPAQCRRTPARVDTRY
jgi:hypothetical protein